jgi:hypothetical protein
MKQLPFKAYEGKEPYIFISYAHKNSDKVFPIIKQLYEKGYRIWYDEGIDPGSEWPESIATHLSDASAVMLFVSPESMASDNVRREITFALNMRKLMLSVFLQPTEMSSGMSLQLGLNQAIHYYSYQSDALFFEKFLNAVPTTTLGEKKVITPAPTETAVQKQQGFFKKLFNPQKPVEIEAPIIVETAVPTISENDAPIEELDVSKIVLPFMPVGTATVTLKNEEEFQTPMNTLVFPYDNKYYSELYLKNEAVQSTKCGYGYPFNSYRFQDMQSLEVTIPEKQENKFGVIIYMTDGNRIYQEKKADITVGMLKKQLYKEYPLSEIKSIKFDNKTHLNESLDVALITTTAGISFYSPIAMLSATEQLWAIYSGPYNAKTPGIKFDDRIIEFNKLKLFQRQDGKVAFKLKSGLSDMIDKIAANTLTGINQYGCFYLKFEEIVKIEVFDAESENIMPPTPLPHIKWQEINSEQGKFYAEGTAEITTVNNEKSICPVNSIFALCSHATSYVNQWQNIYTTINFEVKDGKIGILFSKSGAPLSNIANIKIQADRISSTAEIEDKSGNKISGKLTNVCYDRYYEAIVCPKNGKQGALNLADIKEISFNHNTNPPDVEVTVIYKKDGKSIVVPRGDLCFHIFSDTNFYPASCFKLPTGNYIKIDSLKRMMIHEQTVNEKEKQQWLVFECDDFYGAFPMKDLSSFTVSGMDSFGLRTLKAGTDWIMIDNRTKK